MKSVKLLIFDLGGTVFTKGKQQFLDNLSATTGVPKDVLTSAIDGESGRLYRTSQIDRNTYWQQVMSDLKLPYSAEQLEQLWFQEYRPLPGIRSLLKTLRKQYILAYCSNNFPERVQYLEDRYHFRSWFDAGIFSYEVSSLKREGEVYAALLKQFTSLTPEEALIIDDNSNNLIAPAKAGYITYHFTTVARLKAYLRKLKTARNNSASRGRVAF